MLVFKVSVVQGVEHLIFTIRRSGRTYSYANAHELCLPFQATLRLVNQPGSTYILPTMIDTGLSSFLLELLRGGNGLSHAEDRNSLEGTRAQ